VRKGRQQLHCDPFYELRWLVLRLRIFNDFGCCTFKTAAERERGYDTGYNDHAFALSMDEKPPPRPAFAGPSGIATGAWDLILLFDRLAH
jgi:hypothetical protein